MFTITVDDKEMDALIALITSAKDKNEVINDIGLSYLGKAMGVLSRLNRQQKDQCVSTVIPNREVEREGAKVYISPDKTVISSNSIDELLKFFGKKTNDLNKLSIPDNRTIDDWFDEKYPSFDKYENDYSLYYRDNVYSKQRNMYTLDFNNGRVLIVVYHNDVCVAISPYVDE
jgi:thymidylate synthase